MCILLIIFWDVVMKKIFIPVFFMLSGCTSSAYESGWNGKISGEVFHECALSSWAPGFYFNENVDRLVPLGLLTQDEATRAKRHDVRVGDKECLAYAAYGFNPSKYQFSSNTKKLLLSRSVEYRCEKSPIPCPGKLITIVDGRVSDIEDINVKEATN